MKRLAFGLATLAMLSACASPPAETRQGVGFGTAEDFALERARRDAALEGTTNTGRFVPPTAVSTETNPNAAIPSSDLAAAGIGQTRAPGAPLSALGPQAQAGATNTPLEIQSSGISDEQDFGAVSSRETIESDAERRALQAANRQVIEPTALPTRPSDTGPNIVEYALNAPNAKGQEWYSRSLLSGQGRFERNCAGYRTPDDAQRDFLSRGGPERDPRGIDPDGDGFACGWDPAPFKLAAGN